MILYNYKIFELLYYYLQLIHIFFIILIFTWFINIFNFMDGIDGISAIMAITICIGIIFAYLLNNSEYFPRFEILIISTCFAFLYWNWNPAKIFLGDAGSQLLGWIMALSIVHISSFFEFNYQRLYLFSFISIPFYDVFYVMMLRFKNKEGSLINRMFSIVKPDQNHIHHALLKNHISKNNTLLILLILSKKALVLMLVFDLIKFLL